MYVFYNIKQHTFSKAVGKISLCKPVYPQLIAK